MLPTPCRADDTAYAYLHNTVLVKKWKIEEYYGFPKFMHNYISRTQPKALSASGSFFIAKETFIQVGAIFLRASYRIHNKI